MSKPAGKCLFCGRTGLTKGHVWPDWISKILPVTASHHDLVVGQFETFTSTLPGPGYSVKQRQGSARQRKPRNTCTRCNNEWMSVIENAAIKPMTPLIHGIDVPLRMDDQRALAALLCLINMRLEFLGRFRAIPASDRDAIRKTGLPPAGWCIWLARFTGQKGEELVSRYCGMMAGTLTPPKYLGPEHCNTLTISEGTILADRTGGHRAMRFPALTPRPGPPDSSHVPVLAGVSARWPRLRADPGGFLAYQRPAQGLAANSWDR
jgi:hypothetical protein